MPTQMSPGFNFVTVVFQLKCFSSLNKYKTSIQRNSTDFDKIPTASIVTTQYSVLQTHI